MTRVLGLTVVILFGWALSDAEASCSGSGLTWTCAAGTTPAEVNTALSSATDGATLTFAAGSYTWGGTLIRPIQTKGVTFRCASAGNCDVTWSGTVFGMGGTGWGTNTKLYKWDGFEFINTSGGAQLWWFCTGGNCTETTISQFVIANCIFTYGSNNAITVLLDGASVFYVYGIAHHNTFNISNQQANTFYMNGRFNISTPVLNRQGTANNFFIEDNVFNITTNNNGVGITDGWGTGDGIVFRFNTVRNGRVLQHALEHQWGPSNFEVYGNAWTNNATAAFPDGYRSIHHQGAGQYMVWGNTFNTSSHQSSTIVVLHYRAFQSVMGGICDGTRSAGSLTGGASDGNRSPVATYRGYPCFHQPGRDYDGKLYPMGAWKNSWTDNGAKTNLVVDGGGGASPDYTSQHIAANRDYYNAVSASAQSSASSPFDGTTGMGFGTLANRPTTCTPTPEAADAGYGGVMYWATDQGSWNQSASNPYGVQQNGADGVLYQCSATNRWTTYYTPYTYPHPLQSGGGGGGATTPAAPTNVQIIR